MSPITILTHTPLYVWAILAYLLWQGLQSLRIRSLPLWRLALVPLLFGISGFALLMRDDGAAHLLPWAAAALAAALIGAATAPRILAAGPGRGIVTRAGSPVPLARNLLIFGAHYGLAVASARDPDGQTALAAALLSGATVGYVVGWGLASLRGYRAAAALSLSPSSPGPNRS